VGKRKDRNQPKRKDRNKEEGKRGKKTLRFSRKVFYFLVF
jgi:hypothetical protein